MVFTEKCQDLSQENEADPPGIRLGLFVLDGS